MNKVAAIGAVLCVVAIVLVVALVGPAEHSPQPTTVPHPQTTSRLNQQRLHPDGKRQWLVQGGEAQWYVEATDQRLSMTDLYRVCPKHAKPREIELVGTHKFGKLGKRALVTCPGGKG